MDLIVNDIGARFEDVKKIMFNDKKMIRRTPH
jgi:hypothetical protein